MKSHQQTIAVQQSGFLTWMEPVLRAVCQRYARRFGVLVRGVDRRGRVLWGEGDCCARAGRQACRRQRILRLEESLRWGEATIGFCPAGRMVWAVPVMLNDRMVGGVVAVAPAGGRRSAGLTPAAIRQAAEGLLDGLADAHLTNAALLAENRRLAASDRAWAEAIHEIKRAPASDLMRLYLREEPDLLAAIRRQDLPGAREVLNRVLVLVYNRGRDHLPVLRGLLIELVAMISRTIVACGADGEAAVAAICEALDRLARARNPEELAAAVRVCLDRALAAVPAADRPSVSRRLLRTQALLRAQLGRRDFSRDEAARAAGLSPGHFSSLIRRETGRTFSRLLREMRVNKAKSLLSAGAHSLREIADACGFAHAAHFSRVFRAVAGTPPGRWRAAQIATRRGADQAKKVRIASATVST